MVSAIFYLLNVEVGDDPASQVQGVLVVDGVVVGDAGLGAVQVSTAELLSCNLFTRCSL